jgi:DNA-binding MarR family transcriptional regulator
MRNDSPAYALHKLVFDLDRAADSLLRKRFNISYKRALFLLVLKHHGTLTQHELAVALGYSDPAVSSMLTELEKSGYLTAAPSPEHGRKRLVTITRTGSELVRTGKRMLDSHFAELMASAGVDAEQYQQMTEQLQQALSTRMKEAKS